MMSKRFLLPVRSTFGAGRIIASVGDRQDYYDAVLAQKAAISRNNARISGNVLGDSIAEELIGSDISVNGDNLETVPTVGAYSGDFNLAFYLYALENGSMELKFSKEIYASDIPFRIKSGYRARSWEIVIIGNVTVKKIDMSGSMKELMQNIGGE